MNAQLQLCGSVLKRIAKAIRRKLARGSVSEMPQDHISESSGSINGFERFIAELKAKNACVSQSRFTLR